MDDTNLERQKRYREKLKNDGKRQRVFFLSDAAVEQIKKIKDVTNSPSVNHALEALLTGELNAAPSYPEIIEQAKRFVEQCDIMSANKASTKTGREATKAEYQAELTKLIAMVKIL